MARNAPISPPSDGKPARRRRALALLPLVLAVSGCEAMERMDYLDRFFEPAARPGPVVAMEPMSEPVAPPAPDWSPGPGTVIAMEPRPNPVSPPAADRPLQPGRVRAAKPRPGPAPSPVETDAESRTRSLVRQHHWLTQFWMELTPAQQQRVERQLHRGNVRLAAERADAAAAWDSMGLADRARLVFGSGTPFERPAPAERRDGSVWAGNS
jgi:hypothetical protein